jgi:hypothetical protein
VDSSTQAAKPRQAAKPGPDARRHSNQRTKQGMVYSLKTDGEHYRTLKHESGVCSAGMLDPCTRRKAAKAQLRATRASRARLERATYCLGVRFAPVHDLRAPRSAAIFVLPD